jgi:diguanylate cyclase
VSASQLTISDMSFAGDAKPVQSDPARSVAWSPWQRERMREIQSILSGSGLLQRPALLDALNEAIRHSIATGTPAAALLLDINNFAEINAAWGPPAGDEVLAEAGARVAAFAVSKLTNSADARATAGWLDADHFMVIVPGVPSLEGLKIAAAELVRDLGRPFALSTQSIAVSARSAIVQIPAHGRNVTSVLGRGFRLLNTAARVKPDGVALSEAEAAAAASSAMLERDLAAAIGADQLFIALQPKVEAKGGMVRGAEALARWQHPDRGLLPPLTFIDAAEKSGLIFDFGLKILRDACRAGNELARFGRPLPIAVNVSPHQLAHPDFLSRFLEVIDREGLPPEMLEIELTETAAMMGGERVSESLRSLRRCGISVAIDDFGTGFSNLAALSSLPLDTLKIDRSLVTGADGGGKAGALLEVAVQLGRTFGLTTVAEGVETTAQLERMRALGCDLIQGYITGRPVPAAEFADYYLRA